MPGRRSITKTGRVVRRKVAPESKSEREAICLETGDGCVILRRRGGHPFHDPDLETLEGKRISASGFMSHQTFIMSRWKELDAEDGDESLG